MMGYSQNWCMGYLRPELKKAAPAALMVTALVQEEVGENRQGDDHQNGRGGRSRSPA